MGHFNAIATLLGKFCGDNGEWDAVACAADAPPALSGYTVVGMLWRGLRQTRHGKGHVRDDVAISCVHHKCVSRSAV